MARFPKKEKAETPKTLAMGGNIEPLKKDLAAWRDKYMEVEKKRADVNASLAEIRAKAEANGIPKKAFMDALRYVKEDPEKRADYDNGYILAREAFGLPIRGAQLSLFAEDEKGADDANAEAAE